MRLNHYFDDISFTPFKAEFKGYNLEALKKDLTAGVSVSLLTLPQAMAYALVAGLPLSTGLFAAIFSCLIAAIFGSSRHLIVGPSNAISILIQCGTAQILYQYHRDLIGPERDAMAFQIMTQLTLLVAGVHLLVAGFKLGRLTQFVSYSVVLGYVMGASAAIMINQLYVFLGVPEMEGVHSLLAKGLHLLANPGKIHWMTLTFGLGSLTLLVGLKRLKRGIPYALITYVVSTAALVLIRIYTDGEAHQVLVIGDAGELSDLRPQLMLPHFDFNIMNSLLSVAFAVGLLSILETSSVAKSIASHTGQRLSTNQEILGLGLGNLTSALCGAMPVSGSTSRTFLNLESGAQTRLSAIFGALTVGLILYVFKNFVSQIPLASLSALLLMTAVGLVKKRQVLLCLKSTRSDSFVFLATFLSCLFFSIDVAFYIGVGLSITLYLTKAAAPHVQQYYVDASGKLKNRDNAVPGETNAICFIKIKGELFFGAADLFQTTLKSIAENEKHTKLIILQLKNARDIDATACLALQQLHDYLTATERHLILAGLTLPIWEVISDSGLLKAIGKENIFLINDKNPGQYFDKAIERAKELIKDNTAVVKEDPVVEFQPQGVTLPDPI